MSFFWEWDSKLFGWTLDVVVDIDFRPLKWLLFWELYRKRRLRFLGEIISFAELSFWLGPVGVDVSVLRVVEEQ